MMEKFLLGIVLHKRGVIVLMYLVEPVPVLAVDALVLVIGVLPIGLTTINLGLTVQWLLVELVLVVPPIVHVISQATMGRQFGIALPNYGVIVKY